MIDHIALARVQAQNATRRLNALLHLVRRRERSAHSLDLLANTALTPQDVNAILDDVAASMKFEPATA